MDMDIEAATLARNAASRLAPEADAALPAYVEAAIDGRKIAGAQYFEPATTIALAALVVGIAQFAWGVYRDLSGSTAKPEPETIARKIRIEVNVPESVSLEQRDRVIAVVLEELVRSGNP